MLLPSRYNISDAVVIFIGAICILPMLFNLVGIDFGFVYQQFDPYRVTKFVEIEKMADFREFIRGRYMHTIFVSAAVAIAFLTAILAFVDFSIKKELSTPVVGIALFCSGLFDAFHILVSTNIVYAQNHQFYITSLTWFYCRVFHAAILLLCVTVFLFQSRRFQDEAKRNAQRFIFYMGSIFIMLTLVTVGILFLNTDIPEMAYPYRNATRSYDFFPLALYLVLGFWILPKFTRRYPSIFSKTLLLSMIPAIATQLYMTFGSIELFDNSFNISHFMAAFTFFIPFVGVSLNYVETSKNEKKVIRRLNVEAEERRVAEETLSSVLNSSTSSIMAFKAIHDSSNKIVDFKWTVANPATENLIALNYKKLFGKRLLKELPVAEKEGWFEIFKKVVERNELVNHEYFSQYFQKWFYMVATKLKDGLAVTLSDVSQRKNATQELVNAERLAITGIVARTVAHEVRNPLTNINLSIDYLKGDLQPEDTVYLDIIKRNSERINQLITELLISSKPAELTLAKYPLNRLLNETLERAIDRIQLKGIKLEKSYEEQGILVNADADKLKTALLNIILNAVEAMDEQKGILKISSLVQNKQCVIKIEDNGHGISPEHMKKLFDPFFTKKKSGMGLGLSATHNIIIAHKGVLDVKSEVNRGTLFTISLPLEVVDSNVVPELA